MSSYLLQHIVKKTGAFTLAIDHLAIPENTLTCITGHNGSGKSTLISLLSFLEKPESGLLFFEGQPVIYRNNELLRRRRDISVLLQDTVLFSMNVFDNIAYGLQLRGQQKQHIESRVSHIMELLKLSHLAHRKPYGLSGGEARRIAIARTMAIEAKAYLLDEPTANVDTESKALVENLLLEVKQKSNASIIITTHSKTQAHKLSDTIINLECGVIRETIS